MVLEGYLSRLLVDRFGRYVKGLDAENLRLSAWKGEILLKNLRLVPEALSEGLDLPVDVKWGHVGLFHLSVPWSKLGSKPVCVTLEDVYILVSPLDTWSMDDMERQRRARYQKFQRVESRLRKHLERKASLAAEGLSKADGGGAAGKGMWARLLAKTLDNVQITVKNIHVRYEDILSLDDGGVEGIDGGTSIPRPLSAGVTLRKLVAQTVDENWTPTYVQEASAKDRGGGFVYKLVTVDSLAVYCDGPSPPPSLTSPHPPLSGNPEEGTSTDARLAAACGSFLAGALSDEELEGMFKMSLTAGEDRHSYVVIPASPSLRLRVQRGGGGGTRCKSEAFFNDVGVVLNNSQIANINKMRSTLRDLERWEALYRHRPKHGIKDGPKAWWLFLVKSVSRSGRVNKRNKLGWLEVARLLALRKAYVRLYIARARHQATPEDYKAFTRLDEQLTANEIVAFRLKAMAELEGEGLASPATIPGPQQQQQARQTWTEWLLRRGPSSASAPTEPDGAGGSGVDADKSAAATAGISPAEDAAAKAEFLRAFAPKAEGGNLWSEGDGVDDRILWDMEACLNEGALTLVNAGQPCLRIICDLKAELQKKKTGWKLELGLGSLQAFGLGGKGARATTLLTRRTWRSHEVAILGGNMIQIGDFQVWKSGGVVIEHQSVDADQGRQNPAHETETSQTPAVPSRPGSPRAGAGGGVAVDDGASSGGGGSVVVIKVVLAPHQVLHDRACVEQVTRMLSTRDMRLLTSAAQSKISRLQRATRSSFLHALGSNQRFEVTADIHAPLLILPENPKEHARSSLLVLDLGHIAFRRDDSMGEGNASAFWPSAPGAVTPFTVCSPGVAEGVRTQRMFFGDPLRAASGGSGGLTAENNWRLDVSGVQAVIADSSSFFGELSAPPGASLAPAPPDTAIVEGFDVNVKIRATTDSSTGGLVGLGLEASLPRLSFNLRSSAYLLLTRLLKKELSASATAASSAETVAAPSRKTSAPCATDDTRAVDPADATARESNAEEDDRAAGLGERSLLPRRDRGISTVLTLDLDPVTEIPGEGPGEVDVGGPLPGGAGGTGARAPRRSSGTGARRSSRGRSSSGSSGLIAVLFEGMTPGADGAVEGGGTAEEGVIQENDSGREEGEDGEDHGDGFSGLAVDVRVSAPVILVLLVHDEVVSASSSSSSSGNSGDDGDGDDGDGVRLWSRTPSLHPPEAIPEGAVPPVDETAGRSEVEGSVLRRVRTEEERGGGVDGGGRSRSDEGGIGGTIGVARGEGDGEGGVDGALVLIEISGLQVEYRDVVGATTTGREEEIARGPTQDADDLASREDAGGASAAVAVEGHDCELCISAASFHVKDMHQRAGDAFSCLLSSSAPPFLSTPPSVLEDDPGRSSLDGRVSQMSDAAVRITCSLPKRGHPSDGGEGSGGAKTSRFRASVALGGLWANWNPETVAALSIFAVGVYGRKGVDDDDAIGDKGLDRVSSGSGRVGSPSKGFGALGQKEQSAATGVDDDRAGLESGISSPKSARTSGNSVGTPGGVIVVSIRQVSLWLNKEIHGRRLLLAETGASTVEISKVYYPDGSVTSYSARLSEVVLTDLGTKESLWRTLAAPRTDHRDLPPQEIRLSLAQDSRAVEFPLELTLELQSFAVSYLNQTWLEAFDYVMNGVLGDGPWCPWRLLPEKTKDGAGAVAHTRAAASKPPVVVKRRMRVVVIDPVVKLPAGHAGEGWVALDVKRLTASNSYESRRMGDDALRNEPQLCQVWSVKLDGVDIRSCDRPKPITNDVSSTAVPARAGSSLLRGGNEALPKGAEIEAWWPVEQEEGGPETDGLRSNYVVVGRAPGVGLNLHQHDFSVLWQVLGKNITGPVPDVADAAPLMGKPTRAGATIEGAWSGAGRRQLVTFPYQHKPLVAATFDVTFHLPAVDLVAFRDGPPNGASPSVDGRGDSNTAVAMPVGRNSQEIGRVRSRLLTWRMQRFSDFASTNEVTAIDPVVTENLPWGHGDRKLFGSATEMPPFSHAKPFHPTTSSDTDVATEPDVASPSSLPPDVDNPAPHVAEGQGKRQGRSSVVPAPTTFRWKRQGWPDGGRTDSLALSGAAVLLSRRGWGEWRLWSAVTNARDVGEDSGSSKGHSLHGSLAEEPGNECFPVVGDGDDEVALKLAFAVDVCLSGVCVSLEPWEYHRRGGLQRSEVSEWKEKGGGGVPHHDGSAVVVRTDLAMRMTTAFFLEGHWARHLVAADGTLPTEHGRGVVSLPTAADMRQGHEGPRDTMLMHLKIGKIEAFSRPARPRSPLSSTNSPQMRTSNTKQDAGWTDGGTRRSTAAAGFPSFDDGDRHPGRIHSATSWRTLIEPSGGTIVYSSFAPPSEESGSQIPDRLKELKQNEEQRDFEAHRRGFRRLWIEDWSPVRAVVRPSDVEVVARVLAMPGDVHEGQSEEEKVRRGPNVSGSTTAAASPCSSRGEERSFSLGEDVSVRASGAGMTVRLEDDSGRHFVPPPSSGASGALSGSVREEGFVAPDSTRNGRGRSPEEPSQTTLPSPFFTERGAPLRPQQAVGGSTCPLGVPVTLSPAAGGENQGASGVLDPNPRASREPPRRRFPLQPVVETIVGEWAFRYSRDEGGEKEGTVIETAILSASAVRVVDLLQRQSCHAAFRELLAITPSRGSQPPAQPQRQGDIGQGHTSQTSLPPAGENPDRSRGWLGEKCSTDARGGCVRGPAPPALSSPESFPDQHGVPNVVLNFRKVASVPKFAPESLPPTAGGRANQTPAESSREQCESSPPPTLSRGSNSGNDCARGSAAPASSVSGGYKGSPPMIATSAEATAAEGARETDSRITVSVEVGDPIKVNWNPRTMVALWSFRKALVAAANGSAAAVGESGGALREESVGLSRGDGVGGGAMEEKGAVGARFPPSCSTEIRVGARQGIEVMANKEKEGRRMMAIRAASLDLSVQSSHAGGTSDTAVVWEGRLDGFTASDPRSSNALYSTLVGPWSPASSPAGRSGAEDPPPSRLPASPVVLTFRFAKETWEGIVADVPGGPSGSALSREGSRELLEKSTLALRFSEMEVVYFQPLWLEAVDYLWEGVLGEAVWGGGAMETRSKRGNPGDDDISTSAKRREADEEGDRRRKSASEIHVTLSSPSFVLPGSLTDPRHLALRPRSLEFSSWTGGPDDGESPPSVENCSPGEPVARHMVVDVPGTEISLGYYDQIGTSSRDVSGGLDPGAAEEFSQASEGFPIAGGGSDTTGGERGADSEGGMQGSGTGARCSPILREPIDVKVSVTSMSPAAEADDNPLVERAASASRGSSAGGIGSGFSSLGVLRESGSGDDVAEGNDAVDAVETAVRRTRAGGEERMMKIRVDLTELSLALTPGSRATLIESIGKNILAAGFHGEISENFPWDGTSGLSAGKAPANVSSSAWQPSSPLSSPRKSAFGSRGCAACGVCFDELVSRHQCAWCRGLVCRLCMQTPVRSSSSSSAADVGRVDRVNGVIVDAKGKGELSALICDTCAAINFPETSVDAAGKLRFRFGDDGPVMAVEVAVDVPKIRVDLQPPEVEFPPGEEGEAGADRRRGGMSVEADGFELSYKRTTHRRGGLEASLRAVTVSDPCPGTAFPRILSPAPLPDSGDTPPPQLALSYYFSPTSEAAVQMMVHHLEAIIVPSAIRKLGSFAEVEPRSPQQRGKGANTSGPQSAQPGSGAVLDGMHDLATLQLATSVDGRSEGTPKIPLTCRVTLLNPVAMLPQDETDGDCSALFLQGLVMAHYVRSPRYEKASFQTNSRGDGGDGEERVSAEARDIALEIIRLESQLGRMYGGSGRSRDSGGASFASPGGLGQGTGALEPLTLSLHYSEMEKQLHPMRKNLKCQVDDIKGQITYQDMALFQKILSGCWAGLSAAAFNTEGGDGDSSGGTGPKRQREARADAHPKPTRGALEARGYASTDEVSSGSGEDEEGQSGQHKQNEIRRVYRVVFETRQLGLVLVKQDAVPVVEEVKAYHGVGGRSAGPFPGDELVAVAGELTYGLSYEETIERIISSPRPIALQFRRNLFERWWGREYALNVSSWDGNSLDGIFLAGGGAGDQAVVGSTAAFRPKRRAGMPPAAPRLRPRRGALVVSVSSIPVSHLKLSAVKKILDKVSAAASTRLPSPSTPAPPSEDSIAGGKGGRGSRFSSSKTWASISGKSTIPGGSGARAEARGLLGQRQQQQQHPPASSTAGRSYGRKIRVVFREVEVHAWPPNWRHEIQCNLVRVTVIDDREGRDMPLLRAEAGNFDMTHESGPGMARWGAKSRSPLVHRSRGRTRGKVSRDSLDEDLSSAGDDFAAPISRTTASCEAQVDYYHATGGRWEPLVERVVAQGDREIVALRAENVDGGRSEPSPGNRDEDATKSVVRLSCFEEDVKINVTHAALDVVLRALRDWRDYRNVTMSAGTGERQGDLDGGGAAQRYSPFVLQNRTGLPLEFWAHQDKVDSVSRFPGRGTIVGGTADMPFGKSVEARRNRRHALWMLSLRLLPDDGSDTGGIGQRFLNLPLKETGQSMLQCMLAMEGVEVDPRDGPQGGTRQLRSCDAVWEVALENGRHKVTLRSALQIVNKCGSWLEVRCSTDLLASLRDKSSSREQVVGKVAPGARLPLPLKWSRVEDIRLRPLPHGVGGNASQMNAKNVPNVPSPELGGDESATPLNQYGYSDCSLLVPAARAGEKELGPTMSVIPWVACHPGERLGRDSTTADATLKSLFLFLEGVDGDVRCNATILDPGGDISSSGSSRDSLSARFRRSSARLGGRPKSISIQSPILTQPTNADINKNSLGTMLSASARAGLSLRPLEVVVYASLSFRNLLPVGVGWRVVGARGDPGARVAEGWLGTGEGAHVLEANTMAMKPSFSFKVAGFDWTSPRQVSVKEISRGRQGYGSTGNKSPAGEDEGEEEETWQRPGIGLENIPCRDLSNRTLYLSAEATSPRMNSVLVTIFAGFWVRNLSGLPLTLGEPIPTRVSSYELQEARERAEHAPWRTSSPPRRSAWDVILSAVQSDQHGATEEVFELRLAGRGDRAGNAYTVRWCTAEGTPRPPYSQVRLPSDLWKWEGDWTVDRSGAVAPDAPGMDGGGWESCDRNQAGGHYGSGNFSPSRAFKPSHPVWRRRWMRRRVPPSSPRPAAGGLNIAPRSEPVAESATGSFAVSGASKASRASREGFLREGTSVIYQPASSIRNKGFSSQEGAQGGGIGAADGRANGAALCIRVDDSAWSRPLNISVQGAGGPFHVPGGRWPGLRRPSNPSQHQKQQQERRLDHNPGSKGNAGNVWGEGVVGMYELAYDVRIAPVPWNRTRVITVTSRYTVMNRCDCVLMVKQHGSDVKIQLEPGESRPLHWADGRLEATLSVSMIPRTNDGSGGRLMGWSGPVGLGNIGTFPICIRPNPGVSALPADSPPQSPLSSPSTSRVSSPSRSRPSSLPRLSSILPRREESERMPIVGANRILAVEVNIGRHSNGVVDEGGAGQGFRSSAVQVIFQEESWGTGDRFPTYRLENHTSFRMFYGQTAVPGPGDALPPGRSCLFGWDQPCPAEERAQGILNLSLVLAPEPLSSPEGKRLAKTLNIRRLGEKVALSTPRGRVEVVVEPDGPTKLVRMYAYKSKLVSILAPLSPSRARSTIGALRSASQRSSWRASESFKDTFSGSKRGLERTNASGATVFGGGAPPIATPPLGVSSSSTLDFAGAGDATEWSPVSEAGGGDSADRVSVRELHVFCRAVRVSIVDGDRGEMILGSLERTSMSVAATEREVDVKLNLGSLQIDSHMPGTPFPVILQPVRPGGQERCIRFALVAAPHVKNVTYIKLASLKVEEFDLRLDEGMVRWAQGLADRVLWTLVAERRADEMATWPLPGEAFCSPQASPGSRGGSTDSETKLSSRGGHPSPASNHSTPFASRYVYLDVLQVSSVKVRLSLQRAKDSSETVYVGVKPGQMLLDLMMRMDSAHIKLKSLIVHNATTTRSRLMLTAREHYGRELKQQAFLMLGSLEAFGNPVGLLRGMGQGVQDFVKEPVLGLLKSVEDLAPEELMAGMARGAGSLLKHSVGGVANSVSLITGTVSQNLSTLAMDKEYKLKRAMRKEARGDNKDLIDGIGSAGGSLARGLSDGVTGLIRNPMRGAERDGLTGFAKGVGTGMLGLVVKPVVGVTDAATDVLQGVRITTESIARIGNTSSSSAGASASPGASALYRQHGSKHSGNGLTSLSSGGSPSVGQGAGAEGGEGLGQVRPRRVLYGPERALRPYVMEDARAAALLRGTRHRHEEYSAHLEITHQGTKGSGGLHPLRHSVVLLTRSLVLVLRIPSGELELEQRLDGIQVVEKTTAGVLLHLFPAFPSGLVQGSSGFHGLPPPPSEEGWRDIARSQTKGIPCRDEESIHRLHDMIETAVRSAALRM